MKRCISLKFLRLLRQHSEPGLTHYEAVRSSRFLAAQASRPLLARAFARQYRCSWQVVWVSPFVSHLQQCPLARSPARGSSASIAAPQTSLVTCRPASIGGFYVATRQGLGTPRQLMRSAASSGQSLTMPRVASLAAAPLSGTLSERAWVLLRYLQPVRHPPAAATSTSGGPLLVQLVELRLTASTTEHVARALGVNLPRGFAVLGLLSGVLARHLECSCSYRPLASCRTLERRVFQAWVYACVGVDSNVRTFADFFDWGSVVAF